MDFVYCVYGYPNIEGCDHQYVEKIFRSEKDAEQYLEEENKRAKWKRVTRIDRMRVD